MAISLRMIAQGPGWSVADVVCDHGPQDRPFEEQHGAVSIAAVTAGSFQYRTRQGRAMLVPGALLLGNAGACFECGHEHGRGDRCLAFHFDPTYFESIAADIGGAPKFAVPSLPPMTKLVPLLAAAEAARDESESGLWEELTLRIAGAALTLNASARPPSQTSRNEKRMTAAARRIEASAHESLTLASLAREAAMSPYHFLRTFRRMVGMTPHQFILHTRLRRVAVRLRTRADAVSAIAYEAGFNDLSTFNRRFRTSMGAGPLAWRQAVDRRLSADGVT